MTSFAKTISFFAERERHDELCLERRKQIKENNAMMIQLVRFQNLGAFFLNVALNKYYAIHQLELGYSLTDFLKVHLSHRNLNRVAEQLIHNGRLEALGYEACGPFSLIGQPLDDGDEANLYTHTLQVAGMIYVDRITEKGITDDNKFIMDCVELYNLSSCWKKFEKLMDPLMDPFVLPGLFDKCIKEDEDFKRRMEGVEESITFVEIVLKKEDSSNEIDLKKEDS